jgi:hypothetical protein
MFLSIQNSTPLQFLHHFFLDIQVQIFLDRSNFLLVGVSVDFAMSKEILNELLEPFIMKKVCKVKNVEVAACKDLQDNHRGLIKDMHAS